MSLAPRLIQPTSKSLNQVGSLIDVVILALTVLGASTILFGLAYREWTTGVSTARARLLTFLVFGDLAMGVFGLIAPSYYLMYNRGPGDGALCDFAGFMLLASFWTQYLNAMSLSIATYLILLHPLSRATRLLQRYVWVMFPIVWALSFIASGIAWRVTGFTFISGFCYINSNPIFADIYALVPRAIVAIVVVSLSVKLWKFLRRPDMIGSGTSGSQSDEIRGIGAVFSSRRAAAASSGGGGGRGWSVGSAIRRASPGKGGLDGAPGLGYGTPGEGGTTSSSRKHSGATNPGEHTRNGSSLGDEKLVVVFPPSPQAVTVLPPSAPTPPAPWEAMQFSTVPPEPPTSGADARRGSFAFVGQGLRALGSGAFASSSSPSSRRESADVVHPLGVLRGDSESTAVIVDHQPPSSSAVHSSVAMSSAEPSSSSSYSTYAAPASPLHDTYSPRMSSFPPSSQPPPPFSSSPSPSSSPRADFALRSDESVSPRSKPVALPSFPASSHPAPPPPLAYTAPLALTRSATPSGTSVSSDSSLDSLSPPPLFPKRRSHTTTLGAPSRSHSQSRPPHISEPRLSLKDVLDSFAPPQLDSFSSSPPSPRSRNPSNVPSAPHPTASAVAPGGNPSWSVPNQESMASYLNRKASLLLILFPLAYVALLAISLVRIIADFAHPDPIPLLAGFSRWLIFAQGIVDVILYGVVEWKVKRDVKRRTREGYSMDASRGLAALGPTSQFDPPPQQQQQQQRTRGSTGTASPRL